MDCWCRNPKRLAGREPFFNRPLAMNAPSWRTTQKLCRIVGASRWTCAIFGYTKSILIDYALLCQRNSYACGRTFGCMDGAYDALEGDFKAGHRQWFACYSGYELRICKFALVERMFVFTVGGSGMVISPWERLHPLEMVDDNPMIPWCWWMISC